MRALLLALLLAPLASSAEERDPRHAGFLCDAGLAFTTYQFGQGNGFNSLGPQFSLHMAGHFLETLEAGLDFDILQESQSSSTVYGNASSSGEGYSRTAYWLGPSLRWECLRFSRNTGMGLEAGYGVLWVPYASQWGDASGVQAQASYRGLSGGEKAGIFFNFLRADGTVIRLDTGYRFCSDMDMQPIEASGFPLKAPIFNYSGLYAGFRVGHLF